MKQLVPSAIALFLLVVIVGLVYTYMYSPVTTVVLVRHAERINDTDTSSISADGWERAGVLAIVVREAGVKHIFVTEKRRTGQTAEPAAERLNLIPSVIPADRTPQLIDSIRTFGGEAILVVGHANTLPAILRSLDVHEPVIIPRDVYDDLFVVTVTRFRSSIVCLKYGRPS